MILRLILFLALNFGALGIGGFLMGNAVTGDWYTNLNKAPWIPPGWVFGAAWTTIMLCFSFYMAYAWQHVEAQRLLLVLFAVQWILNVAWNPVFFRFQMVTPGLMVIVALTILVGTMLFLFKGELGWKSLLILPYLLWLLVATSLNGYILVNN